MDYERRSGGVPDANCSQALNEQIRRVGHPLARAAGWMKFVAVLTIVSSLLSLFATWWALLFLWLPIWMSVVLFQAASSATRAVEEGAEPTLTKATDQLRLYFVISGVTTLVALILGVVGVLTGVLVAFA